MPFGTVPRLGGRSPGHAQPQRIEAGKGGLQVTGTGLDVTTSVCVPCEVKQADRVVVSARNVRLQRFPHSGGRFSRNARMPSSASPSRMSEPR
jgi:hypothetical protein